MGLTSNFMHYKPCRTSCLYVQYY